MAFWFHLVSIFEVENYKKSYWFSNTVLMWILAPPGHLPRPKPLKMLGGLFKIEGRPFRARAPPGSILGAKMEPKWRPGAYKIHGKIDAEICQNIYWFFVDFWAHLGAKKERKLANESLKNRTWILVDFWSTPGRSRGTGVVRAAPIVLGGRRMSFLTFSRKSDPVDIEKVWLSLIKTIAFDKKPDPQTKPSKNEAR